jgi:acyl carrier protein
VTPGEVFDVVTEAVGTVMEIDPASLSRDTDLVRDLGADSLAIVEIVEIVEERLSERSKSFVIADDDIERLVTIGDAVDYAVGRL